MRKHYVWSDGLSSVSKLKFVCYVKRISMDVSVSINVTFLSHFSLGTKYGANTL